MNKRLFAAALVCLGLTLPASAQFRYGVTIGTDVSTLSFKQDLFSVTKSMGYSAGVVAEMMFPGVGFGIDFGLNYEQRGATLGLGEKPIWSSLGYGNVRSYLHYLDLPVHLRFKWTRMNGLEDYWAPFVFGGPTFDFLIAHNKLEALNYAGGDVGLSVGLGFELWKKWQVSASYTWGMTYALKTALLTDLSARNNTWDVRVSYFF